MAKAKPRKQPKSKLVKSEKSMYYNLVKDDASILNKVMKWLIIVHYPAYIVLLCIELFTLDFEGKGYIGPASMILPMSFAGSIVLEIIYFLIISYITMTLLIAMNSYRENNPKLPMR